MVLIVRNDLKMGKGKIAAQVTFPLLMLLNLKIYSLNLRSYETLHLSKETPFIFSLALVKTLD